MWCKSIDSAASQSVHTSFEAFFKACLVMATRDKNDPREDLDSKLAMSQLS
jgi:hypothetical protein